MRKDLKKDRKKQNNQVSDKKTELFDEEYIRKAEELEKALWADGDNEEEAYTEEEINHSYEKLVNILKEDGIYREDEAPEEKVIPMTRRNRGKIRWGKVAGVAILCCACIFTASMTSEANRNYFIERIQYATGNDTKIITGNDEENEDINLSEQEAIKDIEYCLKVDVPKFFYRPQDFNFFKYSYDISSDIAQIEYQYQNNIILLFIDKQTENTASNIISMPGEEEQILISGEENIEVKIKKMQEEQDILPTYSAQWNFDNVSYCMSGKIKQEELIKMIKQMRF